MYGRGAVFRFGSYELDSARSRLTRGGRRVTIPERHAVVLAVLAAHAGLIISKDTLIDAAWGDVAVEENSVEKVVSKLRDVLGDQEDGTPHIETVHREGYRFAAPVESHQPRQSRANLSAALAPYRGFVDGHAALQTLTLDDAVRAREVFGDALRAEPDHPASHVGLANACMLCYESTRADAARDLVSLKKAVHHAREACERAASWGEVWATFGYAVYPTGEVREARAALRKAVTLQDYNWLHRLRLAAVTFGDERLGAARWVLDMRPRLAQAHWLATTVFVARQTFDLAIAEVRAGCKAQDATRRPGTRFKASGLHQLYGFLLMREGDLDGALAEFRCELATDPRVVYAREAHASAWYGIGAVYLRKGCLDMAADAFRRALTLVPGHGLAAVGLAAATGVAPTLPKRRSTWMNAVNAAMPEAAVHSVQGDHRGAARIIYETLLHAEPGSDGWMIPADPLLNTADHAEEWAEVLEILRARAD